MIKIKYKVSNKVAKIKIELKNKKQQKKVIIIQIRFYNGTNALKRQTH